MSETMYIIVQSVSLVKAKKTIKDLMKDNSFPDKFYKFLVGEEKKGFANGKNIKNNTILVDWGTGKFMFKIEKNINAEHGVVIESMVSEISNVFCCNKSTVYNSIFAEVA